jgi:hypothetical protein
MINWRHVHRVKSDCSGPAWPSEGEQAADGQRGGEDRKVDHERGAVFAVGWQVLA